MPSPCIIVQLSKALYSDAPLLDPSLREPPCSSSRKRGHAYVSPPFERRTSVRPPSAIRLLLPRTFAIADRELWAAAHVFRKRKPAGISSTMTDAGLTSLPTGVDVGVDGVTCCRAECCSSTTPSQGEHQRHPGQQMTTTVATDGAVLIIVVESFLGFTAVRALLEQSYQHSAACGLAISQPGDDCSDGAAVQDDNNNSSASCATQNRDANLGEREERFDAQAVAETARRLVGWLRLARETAELEDGNDTETEMDEPCILSPGIGMRRLLHETSTNGRRALVGRQRRREIGSVARYDEEWPSAPSSQRGEERRDASLYGVTGRCDAGREWSVFTIEPATVWDQGKPRARPGAHCTGRTLEIKLICHPLITMAPDIRWCLRLIGQAKAIAGLLNANAKLSTLGGGYFLTRQCGQAIHLARAQSQVATALGDLQLAGKCRINEAYNYIWLGQYAQARRIIRAQLVASHATDDTELESVASIAAFFLRRSQKANQQLLQSQIAASGDGGSSNDGGHEWVRQRIDVKTDEWHRVRALPLYCSTARATAVS